MVRKTPPGIQKIRPRIAPPRVLMVTPEVTYLHANMGIGAGAIKAKAGGLADVTASLLHNLHQSNTDIHLALPNYKQLFSQSAGPERYMDFILGKTYTPCPRIHLAEDQLFYHKRTIYSHGQEDLKASLAFQREVINHIIPRVRPDLIHCHDWMTGLIPAAARKMGIPCLFTMHNVHTQKVLMSRIEDAGVDASSFWNTLYFERWPQNYEESRVFNPVDLLATGIFASDYITTVSPSFLDEIIDGVHDFIPDHIRVEVAKKKVQDRARGVLNAPDPSFDPAKDPHLAQRYQPENHVRRKRFNKQVFQNRMGLPENPHAPLFFWPSRLDPVQKGCELFIDAISQLVAKHRYSGLQVAVVADGPSQFQLKDLARSENYKKHVAVKNFNESLSHLGFSASDFMLMPSKYEPCGLPQMISALYGSLPIVHDTGGLRDTVKNLDSDPGGGNGFLFNEFKKEAMIHAIDKAMNHYHKPMSKKSQTIRRVMKQARKTFCHKVMIQEYVQIYESLIKKPLFVKRKRSDPRVKGEWSRFKDVSHLIF